MSDTQTEQQFIGIISQYTKDLSFENVIPVSQMTEAPAEQPQIDIQMKVEIDKDFGESGVHAVSLIIKVEARSDKPIFILELDYKGEFTIEGFEDEIIDAILYVECPRLLFPFARSIVANVVSDGGFPPLYLSPVNFSELYQQQSNDSHTLQ